MKKMLNAMMACTMVAALAFTGCSKDDQPSTGASYSISGNASGSQMVPSVNGSGTGTMTGTYNPNTRVLTYTTGWNGLTGAPTSGGFYNGASGTAGTAVGQGWTMGSGWTGTGSTNGTMTLNSTQESQLLGGNWYYSMGTAANSGGEIRGQMSATAGQ